MNEIIKELYYYLQENTKPDFLQDPEYLRQVKEADRLWDAIAADLGEGGNGRLNELSTAESAREDFWQFALFRRTLAVGISLGRLDV